ncbi:tetratricopeptide repeat protein [Clostridium tyrobutyricum]|uniref:tetratricopeptide repeat protein n=1 Tax=Clostridium tyrobutyricum TaxID=1519 RepID=UPI001C3810D0|nr:tetratricopeptide repeat protein [Clostridium tyrobutyricum]MBV4431925.1 tetratricopeptide repeat protein [Clostridium tyrobutyricum]
MNIEAHFKDKLSSIMFLEINRETLQKVFKVDLNENIYIPLKAKNIVDTVKAEKNMDKIPVAFFIEGMFYVLGADSKFKFNDCYKSILKNTKDSVPLIKAEIADRVKNKNYEDVYILLKGLLCVEKTEEVYDKTIFIIDRLRIMNNDYRDEELEILEGAEGIDNYALPYFYHAIIEKEREDYEKALFYINNYISKGGEQTLEVTDFKESVKSVVDFDRAKEILNENPKEALKKLIPLMDTFGDHASLYYYIAVGYRLLQNYEKAIYYLNEALSIDSSIVEIVNEMGINYASIGDYQTALAYLRKAFEATRSVEICTNIIMCYLNLGDVDNAKLNYDIAKKLDPNDEIVLQIKDYLEKD